ncbi:hypothetical protein D9M71_706130 [compost metagenome]
MKIGLHQQQIRFTAAGPVVELLQQALRIADSLAQHQLPTPCPHDQIDCQCGIVGTQCMSDSQHPICLHRQPLRSRPMNALSPCRLKARAQKIAQ